MSRDLPPRVTSRFKYSKATASPNKWLGVNGDCLLGKNPAGNGLLEGGRNSLLESAQEATLSSVAISAIQRQTRNSG
jgi:hypothetical protein